RRLWSDGGSHAGQKQKAGRLVAGSLGGCYHSRPVVGIHLQLSCLRGSLLRMDFPHLHLLLNHFPIIGTIVGLGLFFSSVIVKNEDIQLSSLVVFVAMALLTIPAFITGVGAQEKIVGDAGISNDVIQRHEGSAELAVWFMEITGALAVIALWQSPRRRTPVRWNTFAILIFSLL